MSSVITTDNLVKMYGGKAAVYRLSLAIPAGSIFALLGDNGAGKSTTIRMLTGQIPADAGRAEILGQNCWANSVALRHRVGYVPEKPRFYDWMTVNELGWFISGFHRAGFLSRYRELIENFRLDPTAKLKNLSKGGYAKIGLALALAVDPEVLILDEPTSGLDLLTRREFLSSMVDLAGEGRTILISSHQIAEVERVASHIAIIDEGKLLINESMEELKRKFLRVRLRYDGAPPDPISLGTILERNGSGRVMQVLVRDPRPEGLDSLRVSANVFDLEETPLTLEEIYASLLARPLKPKREDEPAAEPAAAAEEAQS
jgi:ABC-2 type transport system ATP-binding protein